MATLTSITTKQTGKSSNSDSVEKMCDRCYLLQEARHRIANHFALLNSFIRLNIADVAHQPTEPDRRQILLLLESVSAQIDMIARVNRALAVTGTGKTVDVGVYLHDCLTPFKAGLYGDLHFIEDFEFECLLPPEQMLAIGQIVSEIVTNSIKYCPTLDPVIAVCCRKSAGGDLVIEVTDNGSGLPAGFDPMTSGGMGFRLVRALSKSLDADIKFESANPTGLHFQLTIPETKPPRDPPLQSAIVSSQ